MKEEWTVKIKLSLDEFDMIFKRKLRYLKNKGDV